MGKQKKAKAADFSFSPRPNKANRIKWRPWRSASFAEAEDFDLPVLLVMSTSWSPCGHRMDETALSNGALIKEVNRYFIPIRVDGDRRPDVCDRYLLNGWPTIAFLTPGGDVMTSANSTDGRELLETAKRVRILYKNRDKAMRFEAQRRLRDLLPLEYDIRKGARELDPTIPATMIGTLINSYDHAGGGFGEPNNTPNPAAVELLLRASRLQRPDLLAMGTTILDKMVGDGLFDEATGGFYRCSSGRTWRDPRKEKLLSVNAEIILNSLLAYRLTRSHKYHEVAFRSLNFVDKYLAAGGGGGFFASADYTHGAGTSPRGQTAGIDKTVITSWNCRMAAAYIEAYRVCRNRRYLEYALSTLDMLWCRAFEPERGMAHYLADKNARLFGHLEDQAWAIFALAAAGETTGDRGHFVRADEILDIAMMHLYSEGCFHDIPFDPSSFGLLKVRLRPIAANSVMARALGLLATVAGEARYRDIAETILRTLKVDELPPVPEAAEYALSVLGLISKISKGRKAA
ncbi:MAG: DUF255 domain-containing protein [Chloroflexi bacterium]|nr:DUF255 domain-containing protein [Chloroflexota bacterium]